VFHGLKTGFFCYSLKLNFICYLNRFFTFDYSLWDGGDICFCGQKQTLIIYTLYLNISDCQCNGHSVCKNETGKAGECVECKNMTEGNGTTSVV
jgi:hypothetical protein